MIEERDPLTEAVIGAAIEVHRVLGPGLLESIYERCLCHELQLRGMMSLDPFTVGGYEKHGVDAMRYVLRFPLSIQKMSEEEFQKANFPPGHKRP